ncbi:hypothetical protein MPNT_160002 [Candidatus Methylacidithermus pantelleriae]|uniref:Uncharacterized protein n=1 Tax=Candidatus Methylacidithermus pantelleriae TaxID=2744239 RepID=A0A8J2FS68_9BACT|nr:hypothetical protein MPNT_160002 [Candidatus Methylacidithermus pantelleriae]
MLQARGSRVSRKFSVRDVSSGVWVALLEVDPKDESGTLAGPQNDRSLKRAVETALPQGRRSRVLDSQCSQIWPS